MENGKNAREIKWRVFVDRLREGLEKSGRDATSVSKAVGMNRTYIPQIFSGRSKRVPDFDLAQKLARELGLSVDYLIGNDDGGLEEEMNPKNVPLLYAAWPDADGFAAVSDGGEQAEIARGVSYGLIVPDDTNSPRYKTGEIVFASDHRPPAAGAFAVVTLTDDRAAIREIVAVEPDGIRVRTLTGGDPAKLARETVKSVHRIVAAREA